MPYTHIAKTDKNRFEDLINENGVLRFYKITVVDKDGQESLRVDEPTQGATLGAPAAPKISSARYDGGTIELSWSSVNNASSYTIYRSGGGADKTINGIEGTHYVDTAVRAGEKYSYEISAVDSYGVASDRSDDVDVSTK